MKNFTSIRQALAPAEDGSAPWTARGLRVVFLLGGWKDGVEITDDLVKAGRAWEEKVTNFFLKATDIKRNDSTNGATELNEQSQKLQQALEETQTALRNALSDSFHTPTAMQAISSLITEANSIPTQELDAKTALDIAQWLTKIVTIFGLNGNADPHSTATIGWEGTQIPMEAQAFIYPLSQLRDEVRRQARSATLAYDQIQKLVADATTPSGDALSEKYSTLLTNFRDDVQKAVTSSAPAKEFLQLCDNLRDTHLWDLDIYLEDRDGPMGALVRPLDSSLKQARAEKELRDKEKRDAKAKRDKEAAEKKAAQAEAAKVDPKTMFKTDEWSEWNADGLPTKDKEGNEVSKARSKKIIKEWEKQKKAHDEWLKSQA